MPDTTIETPRGSTVVTRGTDETHETQGDTDRRNGEYLHTEAPKGANTFALWPLSEAAHSCFGKTSRPENIPIPHAWLEFDVDNVEKATAYLESQGHRMLVKNKKEPWGKTVSRVLSPEGLLVAVSFTPSMRLGT